MNKPKHKIEEKTAIGYMSRQYLSDVPLHVISDYIAYVLNCDDICTIKVDRNIDDITRKLVYDEKNKLIIDSIHLKNAYKKVKDTLQIPAWCDVLPEYKNKRTLDNKYIQHVFGMIFDFDKKDEKTYDTVKKILAMGRYNYLFFTTPSDRLFTNDKNEAYRAFKVVIPLAVPYNTKIYGDEKWKDFYFDTASTLFGKYGSKDIIDKTCASLSRGHFIHSKTELVCNDKTITIERQTEQKTDGENFDFIAGFLNPVIDIATRKEFVKKPVSKDSLLILKRILQEIDNTTYAYDERLKIAMSLHHESNADEEVFTDIFAPWAVEKSGDPDDNKIYAMWHGIKDTNEHNLTIAHLYKQLNNDNAIDNLIKDFAPGGNAGVALRIALNVIKTASYDNDDIDTIDKLDELKESWKAAGNKIALFNNYKKSVFGKKKKKTKLGGITNCELAIKKFNSTVNAIYNPLTKNYILDVIGSLSIPDYRNFTILQIQNKYGAKFSERAIIRTLDEIERKNSAIELAQLRARFATTTNISDDEYNEVTSKFEMLLHQFVADDNANIAKYVLLHFIWQVKRRIAGITVYDHLCPVVYAQQNGAGKSYFVENFLAPIADRTTLVKLRDLADSREHQKFNDNFVGVMDELQNAKFTDIESIKSFITQNSLSMQRVMRETTHRYLQQNCTLIGTANNEVKDTIRDSTGNRRFFQIDFFEKKLLPGDRKTALEKFDFMQLWDIVDERKNSPLHSDSVVTDVFDAMQKAQKTLSTMALFISDCEIVIDADAQMPANELYAGFVFWLREKNLTFELKISNITNFGRDFKNHWVHEKNVPLHLVKSKNNKNTYYRVSHNQSFMTKIYR